MSLPEIFRQDEGEPSPSFFRADASALAKVERTPQGGIRASAFLTRTGVFTYRLDDGTERRELRHPDEVFNADTLSSLEDAPLTDLHQGKITTKEYKKSIGHVRSPSRSDSFTKGVVVIQDAKAVAAVESGSRKELSCGYTCSLDMTPGEFEGQRYDAVQRNIRYNHVALGPADWGRAGKDVALHLDSKGDMVVNETPPPADHEDKKMEYETIDGISYKVGSSEHLQALRKSRTDAQSRADASAVDTAKEKTRADKAEGERDTAKAAVKTTQDAMDGAVNARIELHTQAKKILGKDADLKGKSDRQVMVDTITKTDSSFKSDDKMTDDYLRGRFESLATAAPREDSVSRVRKDAKKAVEGDPSVKKTPAQIREDNAKASRNMWQTPLTKSTQK